MDIYKRHLRIWKFLYGPVSSYIKRKFNVSFEALSLDEPCIIVANHVTSWDPLLVALCLKKHHAYFVASEHLFRLGFVTKLLNWFLAPIARKKATVGTDTVKACLRHIKAGHSVCIFAEGDASWNGENIPVFPATGKLCKLSGASLVTIRIEGGYLSKPRWTRSIRRGKVYVHPVNIYSPAELKTMSADEVNDIINKDISENAWERQAIEKIHFKGKYLAVGIENALFMCPECKNIGSVYGEENRIKCKCGLDIEYLDTGLFDPPLPFANIAEWDKWQHSELLKAVRETGDILFHDDDMKISQITEHVETAVGAGKLIQYTDGLSCGDVKFDLDKISSMAMVQANRMLLTSEEKYYEIFTEHPACLRKYLAAREALNKEKLKG